MQIYLIFESDSINYSYYNNLLIENKIWYIYLKSERYEKERKKLFYNIYLSNNKSISDIFRRFDIIRVQSESEEY